MKNYTKSEMQEMQKQAIQRVQEMQRRAEQTRQHASKELSSDDQQKKPAAVNKPPAEADGNKPSIKVPDSPKRISLPVEFPENRGRAKYNVAQEPEAANLKSTKIQEKKGLLEIIDQDKALILALILLLSSEGADLQLILALLYIIY